MTKHEEIENLVSEAAKLLYKAKLELTHCVGANNVAVKSTRNEVSTALAEALSITVPNSHLLNEVLMSR